MPKEPEKQQLRRKKGEFTPVVSPTRKDKIVEEGNNKCGRKQGFAC
jgi:hypothetical protein